MMNFTMKLTAKNDKTVNPAQMSAAPRNSKPFANEPVIAITSRASVQIPNAKTIA